MHEIRDKLNINQEMMIDNLEDEIEHTKDDSKMFKAVKNLKRKRYENPFIHDPEGKRVTNTNVLHYP